MYMRNYLSRLFKNSKGFTLIELLVVIGILGVLAAALIATIDPFEQIKKANDTNSKNTAVEFVDANIRYYTTHSVLPWASGSAGYVTSCGSSDATLTGASAKKCIGDSTSGLIGDGELKPAFINATTVLATINYTGTATSVIACFQPTSKSQLNDPNTIYDNAGNAASSSSCKSKGGTSTTCYWCAQ